MGQRVGSWCRKSYVIRWWCDQITSQFILSAGDKINNLHNIPNNISTACPQHQHNITTTLTTEGDHTCFSSLNCHSTSNCALGVKISIERNLSVLVVMFAYSFANSLPITCVEGRLRIFQWIYNGSSMSTSHISCRLADWVSSSVGKAPFILFFSVT